MARFTFSNAGVQYFSQVLGVLGVNFPTNWRINLFVNDITPTPLSVVGDFTVSANPTYAVFTGAGWTLPAATGGIEVSVLGTNVWNFAVNALGETAYGWFFEMQDAALAWHFIGAKRLTAAFPIPAGGGSLSLDFSLSLQKLP